MDEIEMFMENDDPMQAFVTQYGLDQNEVDHEVGTAVKEEGPKKTKFHSMKNTISIDDGMEWYTDQAVCFLVSGRPNRGKSMLVKHILYKFSLDVEKEHRFQCGLVFSGSKNNKDFDFLPESSVIQGFNEDILDKYLKKLDMIKEKEGKLPRSFIVLDDLVGILNSNSSIFTSFISRHRHYNITVLIAVQYINKNISPTIRNCITYACMFNEKTKISIEALYNAFGTIFDTYKEWKSFFSSNTLTPSDLHTCLIYFEQGESIPDIYTRFRVPDKVINMRNKIVF